MSKRQKRDPHTGDHPSVFYDTDWQLVDDQTGEVLIERINRNLVVETIADYIETQVQHGAVIAPEPGRTRPGCVSSLVRADGVRVDARLRMVAVT